MGELRVAETQERIPPVEWEELPVVHLLHRPRHHLEVNSLIVHRLDGGELGRQRQQAERARATDKQPRREPQPRTVDAGGRSATSDDSGACTGSARGRGGAIKAVQQQFRASASPTVSPARSGSVSPGMGRARWLWTNPTRASPMSPSADRMKPRLSHAAAKLGSSATTFRYSSLALEGSVAAVSTARLNNASVNVGSMTSAAVYSPLPATSCRAGRTRCRDRSARPCCSRPT